MYGGCTLSVDTQVDEE